MAKQQHDKVFPRKLARSVAKAHMEKSGVTKVNRGFADYWRTALTEALETMKAREKTKKKKR